ncbi:hypothetical protein DFJ43DRAFT_1161539 [Lentinula guzmanii]|uniref:Uncharacterized protein n=1 Tax=Lentinula guzmanii TaxID=2804957 RepID=A0AA38J8Q1_9AGAR|nr:hypothetical protein DFJ43DRAFT_1161539 [Lentinula guzmanii]
MGLGASNADWYIPEDTSAAIELFYKAENHGKLGQGGNPTKAALNECAAYLVKKLKIKGIFEATLVLEIWSSVDTGASVYQQSALVDSYPPYGLAMFTYLYILSHLAMKQNKFVGHSGWNYDDETGFGVTDIDE